MVEWLVSSVWNGGKVRYPDTDRRDLAKEIMERGQLGTGAWDPYSHYAYEERYQYSECSIVYE